MKIFSLILNLLYNYRARIKTQVNDAIVFVIGGNHVIIILSN